MNIDPTQISPPAVPLKSETTTEKKNSATTTASNSNPSAAVLKLSNSAQNIKSKSDGMAAYEDVRQDLVNEAKAELDNWDGISDDQVDSIMDKMFNELN
jgi:hypothetical protein